MKLLVTGAAGFIGSTFCRVATEAGHEVVALVRARAGGGGGLPRAVRVVTGRLPFDVPMRAWEGVDGVVHCAGGTRGEDWVESEAVSVEGTRALLAECARRGVKRFVYLSSQSAHEGATSAYGRSRYAAEEVIRKAGVPHAILRPGLVFGPGAAGLFARMRGSVARLPVLPLLGGGAAPVQPVDAEDLARVMLRCAQMLPAHASMELNIGEPVAMKLRDFLQAMSVAERGRRKPELRIPLGPVKAVARLGEALHLPLPVTTDNLKGLENVRPMDTATSLARIDMQLRPFGETMREAMREPTTLNPNLTAAPGHPARVLLVGAGKIGLVHGLNLFQRSETVTAGIVDRNAKAFGMYKSMGFAGPFFTNLDEAIAATRPDGAIVATPAGSHLPLARRCLQAGLGVLVEKPVAFRRDLLPELRTLQSEFAPLPCHTGYMAAQFPQLDTAAAVLRAGEIGAVRGAYVCCLQSHIMAPKPVRWEMRREQSGGGVLINFAGHWVAVLLRLLGRPEALEATAWSIHSTEVEDAAEARLRFDGFEARLLACWSIAGYARPRNFLVVQGETGRLLVEQYHTAVVRNNGLTEMLYMQQDFETGYNFAPDYTGGGFAMEHLNFAAALRAAAGAGTGEAGVAASGTAAGGARGPMAKPATTPVDFAEAADVEECIFDLMDAAAGAGAGDRAAMTILPGSDMDAQFDALKERMR